MTAPILNDRDLALQAAKYRSKQTNLAITGTASAFLASKNSVTILPATIVLTATPSGSVFSTSATYTWSYSLPSAPNTWITLGTGKTWTLNSTDLWAKNAFVYYRCIISENLLDSAYGYYTVTYTSEASEPNVVTLSRTNVVITCNEFGTPISFNNTDVTIIANRGTTSLAYSTNTTTPNSFTVSYVVSDLTVTASPTNTSVSWTLPGISAIALDGAKITFTITVYDASATPVATTYTRSVVYNKVNNGVNNKSITLSMYQWATSAPAYTAAFTYTWSTGAVSAYPAGWSSSAGSPPGSGYTLYQRNIIISDVFAATTTTSNWNLSTVNTIGYRVDGTIGIQGDSYRIAYIVTTSSTAPAQPGVTTAPAVPVGWSTTATATLSSGQYMYQSDGIYSANTGNITWGIPYLSNLKVGNLSALSANLGTVEVAASGALWSGKSTFANATNAGFFLGNDGGNAKFRIGNTDNSSGLAYDTSTGVLSLRGGSYLNSSGTTLLSATTTPAEILNSTAIATAAADATTKANAAQSTAIATAAADATAKANAAVASATATAASDAATKADAAQANATLAAASDAATKAAAAQAAAVAVANTAQAAANTAQAAATAAAAAAATGEANAVAVANTAQAAANTAQAAANTAAANAATAIANAAAAAAAAAAAQDAANAANALANTKLTKSGADILTGPISFNTSNAILVGNTTNGLYLGNTGLVGRKNGVTRFAITNAGDAYFGGELQAATGTFSGDISAASGNFSGTITGASGSFSGNLSAANIITTSNIQDFAVTSTVGVSSTGSIAAGIIASASITATGKPLFISMSALIDPNYAYRSGNLAGWYINPVTVQIYRSQNGNTYLLNVSLTLGSVDPVGNEAGGTTSTPGPFSYALVDTPSAGAVTYHLYASSSAKNRSISIIELKK